MDEQRLADLIYRHAIASQPVDQGEANKIVRLLNGAIERGKTELIQRHAVAQANGGLDKGPGRTKFIQDSIEAYTTLNREVYGKIAQGLEVNLTKRAEAEQDFAIKAAKSASVKIDKGFRPHDTNFLRTLVNTTLIPTDNHAGAALGPWIKGMAAGDAQRFENTLRTGILHGDTTEQLAKRIEAGGWAKSRQSAQTVALTANSAVANAARLETFKSMKSIAFVEWSSILDTRTSAICQSLSGKIFAIDEPHPTPPAHPRCRSLLLGRKNDTDPPLHQPYRQWLKNQDAETQDKVLGKKRGQAFRDGKLPEEDLTTHDGSTATIEDLRAHTDEITGNKPATLDPVALDAKAKAYVLEHGISTGNEQLIAFDRKTGENLLTKEGDKSSVTFTPALMDALANPANDITLHHNHPRSSSFSSADINVVTQNKGAGGIWAHAHNGSSFYAEATAKRYSPKTATAVANAIHAQIQKLVTLGTVTIPDAMLIDNHLTWQVMANYGQISYVADLQGPSLEAYDRNKTIYEQIVKGLSG